MNDSQDAATDVRDDSNLKEQESNRQVESARIPSNDVYARVGDTVLRAARDGVRRGMRPDDIIREIVTDYNVRLTIGELRLLLAARQTRK